MTSATLTGRTRQAVLYALRKLAREKSTPPKLRWDAVNKLMELEQWGITNQGHVPKTINTANANKLRHLAKEARERKAADVSRRLDVADAA